MNINENEEEKYNFSEIEEGLQQKKRSLNEEVNDQLTIEGMLQVRDSRTGKKADVRAMLAIQNHEIKDQDLREKMKKYSIKDSSIIKDSNIIEDYSVENMGDYLKGLDVLEFDTGKFEEEAEANEDSQNLRKSIQNDIWKNWWQKKEKQNQKLFQAILQNDTKAVEFLLSDKNLILRGEQPDINCTLEYDGMRLSPLLLAIRFFQIDQKDIIIISTLLKNYADVNFCEESTGFNALIMACHLVSETDSFRIIKLLCEHRHYENQEQLINIDHQDSINNTALHHAALTNKQSVCQYLIEDQKACVDLKNQNEQQAIDLCTFQNVEKYLSQFQKKNDQAKKKSIMQLISGAFKKKNQKNDEDFISKYYKEQQNIKKNNQVIEGKRIVQIKEASNSKNSIQLSDFKIINKLGGGAFGTVFLVCPKKQKQTNNGPLYAMKVLQKDVILQQNLARYVLTERNVLMAAGKHPFIVELDFAFQNDHRLYLIMEFCPGGDLSKQIKLRNHLKSKMSEQEAKLYICEIILALQFLHQQNIVYRDLKPENIVLTADGHVKLTDFGLSKSDLDDQVGSQSFVGSIAYLAPEILKKQNHFKSIDWYLTGLILYEMIVGQPPYYKNNRKELLENILSGPLRIPQSMSFEARDLILNLLNRNPKKRLGAGPDDALELMKHDFFKDVDWKDVLNKKQNMPKIDISYNIEFDQNQEKIFQQSEKESKEQMKNFLKEQQAKLNNDMPITSKQVLKIEQDASDFNQNPEKLRNWSFVGANSLKNLYNSNMK